MIRIAVVEDDDAYAQTLAGYIRRYVAESKEALACERFADGMTFLEEQRGGFDIVLLDIAMPHMNGLEAAKRLRAQDENVCIIFITTLAKYAIRGYEVNALDFLVKPVEYELFRIKLQKALAHCRRSRAETFGIVTAGEMRRVRFADISFVESDKHYLIFHVGRTSCAPAAPCETSANSSCATALPPSAIPPSSTSLMWMGSRGAR